jgi:4-hydroxybenzoate polyprenyltransferase
MATPPLSGFVHRSLAARLGDWLLLMRPAQWTKNLLCLAGPLFSTIPMGLAQWQAAALAVLAFCLLSAAVYAVNDIADAQADRLSERKRHRPVASGRVSPAQAWTLATLCAAAACAVASFLPLAAQLSMAAYLVINALYSRVLKHLALVDVFCISLGFILRLLTGIYAIGDRPTAWIVLCTMALTMFVGFSKRRAELHAVVSSGGTAHRPALASYSVAYLDFLVSATSTTTVVTYALFTTTGGRDPTLLLTVLPVVFAVFHYQRNLMLGTGSDAPEWLLLRDRVLWACAVAWLAGFLAISHFQPGFLR